MKIKKSDCMFLLGAICSVLIGIAIVLSAPLKDTALLCVEIGLFVAFALLWVLISAYAVDIDFSRQMWVSEKEYAKTYFESSKEIAEINSKLLNDIVDYINGKKDE